jgi:hypothetical protein
MAHSAFVDAEVVGTGSDNLIQFPDNPVNPSRQPDNVVGQPSRQPDYSSQDLADIAKVSRQSWIKDWYPHLAKVAPESVLKDGRRYTTLCSELNQSLLAARRAGQSSSAWVASASARRPDQSVEARAEIVARASEVAIVPVAVEQLHHGQSIALTQAVQLQDMTQILLTRLSQGLELHTQQVETSNQAITEAAIIADETARILAEQQLRARVRSNFDAAQNAAIAQRLQRNMEQLQGGQHG